MKIVCRAPDPQTALFLHSPHQVRVAGRLYPTALHAYAAELIPLFRDDVLECASAEDVYVLLESKLAGMEVSLDEKLAVLEAVLRAKLDQHPFIWDEVLGPSDGPIVMTYPADQFLYYGPHCAGSCHVCLLWQKIRENRHAGGVAQAA